MFDLNRPIHDGGKAGTLSDEQIVTRGRRQAELIHELLEWYGGHPDDDLQDLADELDMTMDRSCGSTSSTSLGAATSCRARLGTDAGRHSCRHPAARVAAGHRLDTCAHLP